MTTPPTESPPPIIAPTLEETRALNNSLNDQELRALAQQILKSGELGFEPATILKGEITEIALSGSPPTLSINVSGDTTTTISNVRLLDSYSPQVGHTVLVVKQGPDIVVIGHIADLSAYSTSSGAGAWTKATLAAGSHDGNGNGDICYRRVLDYGSWKMQWRGGWNVSGTIVVSSLAAEFRPGGKRSLVVARHVQTGATAAQLDFHTDGRVELVGGTTSPSTSTVSGDVGTGGGFAVGSHQHTIPFDGAGGNPDHNHFGVAQSGGGFSLGDHDHGFFGGSHGHTVSSPTWVSLNGLEYFL